MKGLTFELKDPVATCIFLSALFAILAILFRAAGVRGLVIRTLWGLFVLFLSVGVGMWAFERFV